MSTEPHVPQNKAFAVDEGGVLILETDDWVEACEVSLTMNWPRIIGGAIPRHVRGVHPSHEWPVGMKHHDGARCGRCGAWNNGSYGSHAPCGYDWSRDSLVSALEREKAARS